MKNLIVIIVTLGLLSACSTLSKLDWTEKLPPKAYFIQHHSEDTNPRKVVTQDQYLIWVHRFYFGWSFYPRGWTQTTEELIETLATPQEKQQAAELMFDIAKQVSPEWAKDSSYRVINTRHLSIWGNALNESVSTKQQISLLIDIQKDVKALLNRDISPKAITSSRYFEDEEFGADLAF